MSQEILDRWAKEKPCQHPNDCDCRNCLDPEEPEQWEFTAEEEEEWDNG